MYAVVPPSGSAIPEVTVTPAVVQAEIFSGLVTRFSSLLAPVNLASPVLTVLIIHSKSVTLLIVELI